MHDWLRRHGLTVVFLVLVSLLVLVVWLMATATKAG
jgi:Na+-transporting methylmalonyl-CoA/oxaloacetate decarboxylase gamma subunit